MLCRPFRAVFALIISYGNFDLPQNLFVDLADRRAEGCYRAGGVEIKDAEKILVLKVILRLHAAAGHEGVGDADRCGVFERHLDVVIIILLQILRGGEEKANPKITAYQVELAQVEAEIEKLLDTLTGANATLLAYANKKIEDLDNRRKTLSKAIADLSVETLSSQQIELLSGYLDDWENISFEDKRKAADGLISSISATSDYVKIEWKI